MSYASDIEASYFRIHTVEFTTGNWVVHVREYDGSTMVVSDAADLAVCNVIDYSGMPADANGRLLAASPLGFIIASEVLRALDPRTGRECSRVTATEMEPIRRLAAAYMAKVNGQPSPD